MSYEDYPIPPEPGEPVSQEPPGVVIAEVVQEPPAEATSPGPIRRQWRLPLLLFIATCLSTLSVGGWVFALCLMTILVCHEAGHYVQARRYGVFATYPYFLPMPFSPLGTFGAVIAMDRRIRDRKALFDIGITGPLAGLVPTLIFCAVGLCCFSEPRVVVPADLAYPRFGAPLLFEFIGWLRFGPMPEGREIVMGSMAFAGWVGLLVTSLNLFPIGQLDGGHVLYALLRRRAHAVAVSLLLAAIVAIVWLEYYWWTLMVVLLAAIGPKHPPTSDDGVPLGRWRVVLGWLTLAFLIVGFTPNPFALTSPGE